MYLIYLFITSCEDFPQYQNSYARTRIAEVQRFKLWVSRLSLYFYPLRFSRMEAYNLRNNLVVKVHC